MKVQRAEHPAILAGHDAAQRFFAPCFENESGHSEELWVAHVDERARCLQLERYSGVRSSVDLPVGSIMRNAARLNSAGVFLAHNHPSGDIRPSQVDCRTTRKLAEVGESLDVAVVDHLIFAPNGQCSSLRRMGLL